MVAEAASRWIDGKSARSTRSVKAQQVMASGQHDGVNVTVKADALLGEGPVWDGPTETLYWLDIKGKYLHALSPARGKSTKVQLSTEVGAVAPRSGGGLVAAARCGFCFLDPVTGNLTAIADPESHLPNNRFNDGSVDPSGSFVAGSMDDLETAPSGTVYRLDPEGKVTVLFGGYVICNGPVFSRDGRTLYFSDSVSRRILSFPYDPADGSVGDASVFARLMEADGYPDGLTVDADGGVWCAHWGGGRITRFTADGKVDGIVEIPVPHVTSCTFGGPDYRTLYVTTARWGLAPGRLKQFPLSGSLFAVDVGVHGLPLPTFAG